MSDLIDRNALLAALTDRDYIEQSILDLIDAQPAITPAVVANITGGVLQGVSGTHAVDVYCLDFKDTEESDVTIRLPDGSEAWLGQEAAVLDPLFVQSVIDAPAVADVELRDE